MHPSEDFRRVIPEGIVSVMEIDVKALSEVLNERDFYLSVYMPTVGKEDVKRYLSQRLRAINKATQGVVREEFEKTYSMVEDYLFSDPIEGERSRIIFASAPESFIHVYRISLQVSPKLILDTSPFLLPLAELRDDYQDYGLLLVDSRASKLFLVRSNVMDREGEISIDLMNRHKKGGMSQMRFNRLRREAIDHFLKDVVEMLKRTEGLNDLRGVVLAGPGEVKKMLYDMLPPPLKKMVIGMVDTSINTPEEELIKLGDGLAIEDEQIRSSQMAEDLRKAVLKGNPSAYGAREVKKALEGGRVETLIILKGTSIPGWICERCQRIGIKERPPSTCPSCGGPTSAVDVVEELYELAQRTGAEVEFVSDNPFLQSIGGLGALLRY